MVILCGLLRLMVLKSDLSYLVGDMDNLSSSRILVMGDMNVQPSRLGGVGDRRPRRDRRWESLMLDWHLVLRNPAVVGSSVYAVTLPFRKKTVSINPGHTHHGVGRSSAIDLVLSSESLMCDVKIHNRLHCCDQESGCSWDMCLEFTQGDHFLLEVLTDQPVFQQSSECMRMPSWWSSDSSWRQGLHASHVVHAGLSC